MSKGVEEVLPIVKSRGDERRESLILAAYQSIAEKGFEGLRVRDVAEQVGVNIATLHYYFKTKDDLVRGVVEYVLQQFLTITAPRQPDIPQTPVTAIQEVFLDLQYQLEHVPEMFVVLMELYLHARRNPEIHHSLVAMSQGWRAHLEQVCREGIASGHFRADLDAHQSAALVTSLITGMSLQAISQLNTFDFDQIAISVIQSFKP